MPCPLLQVRNLLRPSSEKKNQLSKGSVGHDEMDEGPKGNARRSFGEPGLGVIVPGGAGDVEVDPRRVARKFLDEHGAGDGASTFAASNVLNVGHGAFDEFAIVVVDGHLPHFFAG